MLVPVIQAAVILGDPRLPDQAKIAKRFREEDFEAFDRMKEALGGLTDFQFHFLENHQTLLDDLRNRPPRFAVNFCDTGYRNDATLELHIPALLELLDIPYSGCGPVCLGVCYDKAWVRSVAAAHGIATPEEIFVRADGDIPQLSSFPALIKPNRGDGSVGITQKAVVSGPEEAVRRLGALRREWPGRDILVQEFLTGTEYGVGLIGNPDHGFTVLPPLEVDFSELPSGLPKILSYESKADPESPYWSQIRYRPARLEPARLERMVEISQFMFERLGCRDYARFDFRADSQGTLKLLEVNPNPAWCWDGKMAIMAGFEDRSYPELLRLILQAAVTRLGI